MSKETKKLNRDLLLPTGAPLALLLFGLLSTAISAFYIHTDVAAEETRRFSDLNQQIREQIRLRIDRYQDTLLHTRAFFAASDDVSRAEFHTFFETSGLFGRYPGFQGVGFAARIPAEKLSTHTQQVRRQGFPNYSVWPNYPRAEYSSILYLEPFDWRNQRAFGFDMFTEKVRHEAMVKARDVGSAVLSGKVKLVQETDERAQPGFLLYLPLYTTKSTPLTTEERREKLLGYIYSPFRANDLFSGIFQEKNSVRTVQFEIYDGSQPKPDSLLYDSDGELDFGSNREASWKQLSPIELYSHTWTIYVSSLPAFTPRTSRYATLFVSAVGILFSVFGFWILRTVKRRMASERERLEEETAARKQVEVLAAELRAAVRERNYSLESLETINKVGRIISGELDLERLMQAVNDAATSISRAKFGAFFYNQTDSAGEHYTLYTISGVPREKFANFPMPRPTAIFAPTFAGAGVVRSNDITQDPRYGLNAPNHGMPAGHLPVKSYLAVPVVSRSGEVLGGLFLGHPKPGVFTKRDEKAVLSLAAQAAVAVDNARLFRDAREAVAARDDFLSICSHELRTPLTSLKLQTQLTRRLIDRENFTAIGPEKFRRFLDNTNMQIDRLVRLVEDMLDISRIRAGKLSLRPEMVDLRTLVTEVAERFSPQLALSGSGLTLQLDEGVSGKWDKFRIEQVLVNLLSNATKYGGGSPIEVKLSRQGDFAQIEVADGGMGIDKNHQNRIFERFERAVSKQNISGLGLGLFIVRQIVETHSGSIHVESEVGQGARFIVKLPLQEKASHPPPREETVPSDTTSPPGL